MKSSLSLALLAVMATTSAASLLAGQNSKDDKNAHHRTKRAFPKLALLPLLAQGGSSEMDPPHGYPSGSTIEAVNRVATHTSMSGPFAVIGVLQIALSLFMAMNYFREVNRRNQLRRSWAGLYNEGQYVRRRFGRSTSAFNINPEAVVSFLNSLR